MKRRSADEMKLYLVRHGIALNVGEQGVRRDADRPLTEEGREKTRAAALGLKVLGHVPDVIGTSPLVRAEQTAHIFHEALGVSEAVEVVDFMAPGGAIADLMTWLKKQPVESAMVVGHMPDLAWFTHSCIQEPDRHDLHFKKAAVACVAFDGRPGAGRGRLEWVHQPRYLRQLAEGEGLDIPS